MEARKTPPQTELDLSPAIAVSPSPIQDPVLDELSRKMQAWSEAWFGCATGHPGLDESRVRQRLLFWLKRCLGGEARTVLANPAEDVSLAKSAPLLTAFLGRRAMVELSRRVLND